MYTQNSFCNVSFTGTNLLTFHLVGTKVLVIEQSLVGTFKRGKFYNA